VSARTLEDLTVNGGLKSDGGSPGIVAKGASLVLEKVRVTETRNLEEPTGQIAAVSVLPSSGSASLTVLDSTISDNIGASAGAIYVSGPGETDPSSLQLVNSTISGNNGLAGGLNLKSTLSTLRDDTIAANEGQGAWGGVFLNGVGNQATVTDSLIATNTNQAKEGKAEFVDCRRSIGTITDGGHNLIGVANPGCGFANGVHNDLTGSSTSPLDPQLGPLAQNGGPTQTQALLSGASHRLVVNASSRQRDRDAGAAEVDEGDQWRGGVKPEAAV
jgi:hypothetical protein